MGAPNVNASALAVASSPPCSAIPAAPRYAPEPARHTGRASIRTVSLCPRSCYDCCNFPELSHVRVTTTDSCISKQNADGAAFCSSCGKNPGGAAQAAVRPCSPSRAESHLGRSDVSSRLPPCIADGGGEDRFKCFARSFATILHPRSTGLAARL